MNDKKGKVTKLLLASVFKSKQKTQKWWLDLGGSLPEISCQFDSLSLLYIISTDVYYFH